MSIFITNGCRSAENFPFLEEVYFLQKCVVINYANAAK